MAKKKLVLKIEVTVDDSNMDNEGVKEAIEGCNEIVLECSENSFSGLGDLVEESATFEILDVTE